jgi:osmotically-inducible protein OsmY
MNQLDAQAGRVVEKVDAYVSDAGLSAKIKSKMALDELVGARTIDVSTTSGVVTLEGTVRSLAERDQALRLARDTASVTRVVDRLVVLP